MYYNQDSKSMLFFKIDVKVHWYDSLIQWCRQQKDFSYYHQTIFLICGVIVSVLASSVVDRGIKPWSCETRDYKIGICCFSAKHAALRRKSEDWLAQNQVNVRVEQTILFIVLHDIHDDIYIHFSNVCLWAVFIVSRTSPWYLVWSSILFRAFK